MNVYESLSISPALAQAVLIALLGTLMLLLGLGAHAALGRKRARMRSAVWNACALGLVALPAALAWFPGMRAGESKALEMSLPPVIASADVEARVPAVMAPVQAPAEP